MLLMFLFKRLSRYSLFVSHDLQSSYELLAIGAFNTLLGCSNNRWYNTLLHGWCRVIRLKVVYKHKFPEGTIGLYESLKYALNKCSFSSYFNRMQFEELNFKTNLRNEIHQYFGCFFGSFPNLRSNMYHPSFYKVTGHYTFKIPLFDSTQFGLGTVLRCFSRSCGPWWLKC